MRALRLTLQQASLTRFVVAAPGPARWSSIHHPPLFLVKSPGSPLGWLNRGFRIDSAVQLSEH